MELIEALYCQFRKSSWDKSGATSNPEAAAWSEGWSKIDRKLRGVMDNGLTLLDCENVVK